MAKKITWIILLFVLLPLGLYLLIDQGLDKQEHEWSQEVLKDVPAEKQQQFQLQSVCFDSQVNQKIDLSPVCIPYKNTRYLRATALAAAVTPIGYSLLLLALSVWCRRDRVLLLRLFRPGIYISTMLVALLVIVQWLLISGAFYAHEFGQLTSDDYFWIALFGVVAIIGVFFTIRPLLKGAPRATTSVTGFELSERNHPTIWNFVRSLASKAEAKPPDHLVVGFTPNFFATEATVECISGKLDGATMYLSLPLCRILTTEELAAVILHELSHFKGKDAAFTIRFYPIYRGVSESLYGVANASAQISKIGTKVPITQLRLIFVIASLSLLPSVYLLRFFFDSFSYAENQIGRERELAADALAASIQDPRAIASALVKLSAFTSTWVDVIGWAQGCYAEGAVKLGERSYDPRQFFVNMSEVFHAVVQDRCDLGRLKDLDAVDLPHPTDTHPPLSVRLTALHTSVSTISPYALSIPTTDSGSSLIDNVEDLEIQLSRC